MAYKDKNDPRKIARRSDPEYRRRENERRRLANQKTRADPEKRAQINAANRERNTKLTEAQRAARTLYNRRFKLAHFYNLTPEQWDAMFAEQGNKCACCGSPDPDNVKGWSTDHEPGTKHCRGILCRRCNTALGKLGDTLEKVEVYAEQLLSYLRRDREKYAA